MQKYELLPSDAIREAGSVGLGTYLTGQWLRFTITLVKLA